MSSLFAFDFLSFDLYILTFCGFDFRHLTFFDFLPFDLYLIDFLL